MIARFLLLEYAKKIANCLVGRAQCQDSHIMTPEPGSVGFMGVNPAGIVPQQAAIVGAGVPTRLQYRPSFDVRITVCATQCRAGGVCETRVVQLI